MTVVQIILLSVLEALGILLIARLWFGKPKASLVRKVTCSILLLVPFFGPLAYGFISLDPSGHGEDVGDHSSGGAVGDTGEH